jgi:Bifunctional DNA primase/polymerase, N-terminal
MHNKEAFMVYEEKHPTSGNLQGADFETARFHSDHNKVRMENQEASHQGHFSRLYHQGLSVFPVKYGTKEPALSWKRFMRERCTIEECQKWDAGRYNIGIATGAISGHFVLDVDGVEGEATLAALERTAFSQSSAKMRIGDCE